MARIHGRFAAQARRWEVDGMPAEFVNPPEGYARRAAEDGERLAEVWVGPLLRQLFRPHPEGWRRFSRVHRFRRPRPRL